MRRITSITTGSVRRWWERLSVFAESWMLARRFWWSATSILVGFTAFGVWGITAGGIRLQLPESCCVTNPRFDPIVSHWGSWSARFTTNQDVKHFIERGEMEFFEKELRELLQDSGYEILLFRELPEGSQFSMAHYMCVDGAAWAVDHPEYSDWEWGEGTPCPISQKELRSSMLEDLKKFMPRFIRDFGDTPFGYSEVDTRRLGEVITACNPYCDGYTDFGACKNQSEYPKPTWSVILTEGNEILQDGWHRFSNYFDLGIERTPAIWYVD